MSRTVGAERYNTQGRRVENVDVTVNVLSPSVHLHIHGDKRDQSFWMHEENWLEIARLQLGEKRYAACWKHTDLAIQHFGEGAVHIRPVTYNPDSDSNFTCVCGEPANVYLMEVKGKLDQPEYPKRGTQE